MLLSNPFPHPSSPLRLVLRCFSVLPSHSTLTPRRRLLLPSSLRASHQFHSQPAVHRNDAGRPWPEWSRFLEHVTFGGYTHSGDGGGIVDAFDESLEVPEVFAKGVRACLSFSYNRPTLLKLLSQKDIRVVVENVSPFLFKNSSDTVKRMDFFLNPEEGKVIECEKVQTADLVRYLISYAYNQFFGSRELGGVNASGLVEASICNLLNEMVNLSGPIQTSYSRESNNRQSLSTFEQSLRSRSTVEMKRGDWICPKCNYLNFARNMNCLECSEIRPKRQLTGGEWECPKCFFFNYGRNMACLKCDCERPGNNFPCGAVSEVSTDNTSSAREEVGANNSITRSLDRILGKKFDVSGTRNNDLHKVYVGRRDDPTSPGRRNSDYVPFVPLPTDMFKTPGVSKTENQSISPLDTQSVEPANALFSENSERGNLGFLETPDDYKRTSKDNDFGISENLMSDDFPEIMPMRKGENRFVVSKKKDRSLTSPQYKRRLAMEQANDSNFVPFVPFPPDYFTKKDNQPETGSAAVKADPANTDNAFSGSVQIGPEGSDAVMSSPKWTPSKNSGTNQQNENQDSSKSNWYGDMTEPAHGSGDYPRGSYYNDFRTNVPHQSGESRFSREVSNRTDFSGSSNQPPYDNHKPSWVNDQSSKLYENSQGSHYNRMDVPPTDRPNTFLGDSKSDGPSRGYPLRNKNSGTDRVLSSASQPETNQGTRESSGWKSLEGSAVTEPDPLDMSEEAKAQRWFRRVAQITDISELANIPDEDFPQIMPMRKGVNRFVVSKRKTPLERRLTSSQYRRNLPIVSSEPENDSSNKNKS